MLLRRHRAAGTWQGEGAHADLCFMLWARDLDWSLIGNDNGAGVAYCHVKHSEWLMTIKVNAEEKRNWNHWFESSRSYIFSQHNDAHVDMHVHSNARIICPIFHCRGFICVSCYLVISKNKKRRRRGWVLTIRRRDQATHTLMSQSCFLMCLCTAGHINTSTADASILNNPKKPRESVISWLCNGNDEAGHVWTAHLLPTLSQTPFLLCTALFLQHVIDSRPLSPP